MNRTLMFGIVAFLALVGFALLGGMDSVADAGHCHGCYGGCYGCYGGCYGCYGGYAGYGCHGCWGGWHGCHGGYGGCCGGYWGCSGCCGGYGGGYDSVPPPPTGKEPPKKAETKPLGFREVSFRR